MKEPQVGKPTIAAALSGAIGVAVTLVIVRGAREGRDPHMIGEAIAIGVPAALAYCAFIYGLVKGWDWLWARFKARRLRARGL